ncbi:MAG: type I restriction-modification system subunit M [Bacteroidetes bacterium]|nr:type I restriction-modification system subunit M [Bacteroidota bacterium]
MALKKSELYSSLWKSCDELRGGMDASQYKDYVLVLLFVKYVSDKYANDGNALIEIPKHKEAGKGGSFSDMVFWKGKKEIGDELNKIIARLAEANDLTGVIDVADFNDDEKLGKGKEMTDRLSNLISIFENPELDFSKNRADGDDILGDAYEYLMRHFATESGKSKGQFYTPSEVSRVIAKIIGINQVKGFSPTIYDPTCGSGSLLLKAADETDQSVSIYGQEKDVATAALAKMNMILHNNPTADIRKGQSTLSNPLFTDPKTHQLKTFDFVVANPPFSNKAWRNGFDPSNDEYNRFADGIPPTKNGDFAFLLHIISSLRSKGKGAIILPHGVLFRGNAEAEIRKNLIRRGYIKGIISLPANLFYGTGIPACIIVIDKENAAVRTGIFMIDASKSFVKDGNKNRLREQDIHKIVDVFNNQKQIEKYSRLVSHAEIADEKNDFNLNIPRYIDSQETEDIQDIEAHLLGGIPKADVDALENYWQVYPTMKSKLFTRNSERSNYFKLKIEQKHIRVSVFSHPEFTDYANEINRVCVNWHKRNAPVLKEIRKNDKPKKIIHTLSENLLAAFAGKKLIDNYDIYQYLMTYWAAIMQDDVYSLVTDGWDAGNEVEYAENKKDWEGRIIPKLLLTAKYFRKEQEAIERLEADRDGITREMEEIVEEHSGEEGLLEEVKNDKGKITKGNVQHRIRELIKELSQQHKQDQSSIAAEPKMKYGKRNADQSEMESELDELTVLEKYLSLIEKEAEANKKVKEAQAELEKKLLVKYKALSREEIKTLVVDDKWLTHINHEVQNEMDKVSQRLAQRINELVERYTIPLPQLAESVKALEKKVNAHLGKIAFQ